MTRWKLVVCILCTLTLVACAPKTRRYEKTVSASLPADSRTALSRAAIGLAIPKTVGRA